MNLGVIFFVYPNFEDKIKICRFAVLYCIKNPIKDESKYG